MKRLISVIAAIALAGGLAPAAAQDYPGKSIRIIVPFAPGGGSDFVARLVAAKLTTAVGQPVIVENRPGANGQIGTEAVVKAAPDGYTLLFVTGSHVVNPALFKSLPYDTANDLAPISLLVTFPNVLVVHPSVPARNYAELVALLKSKPREFNAAIAQAGTLAHLTLIQIKSVSEVDFAMIPYKGSGQAVTDLLEGRVQLMSSSFPAVLQHIKSGRLRAICVTSEKPAFAAPEIPACADVAGRGLVLSEWFGMFAPAKTPAPVIDRLQKEIKAVLVTREVSDRLQEQLSAEVVGSTPGEFGEFIKSELPKWVGALRRAGVEPE